MRTSFLPQLLTILFICCFSWVQAQPITNGLVAYWPLNGNFNDASGNGINGTNIGVLPTANRFGAANSAMAFSGASGMATPTKYAVFPTNNSINFSGNQNFTLSFMFSVNSPFVPNAGLFDNNLNFYGYGVYFWEVGVGAYRLQFNYKNASLASSNLPLATWIHVTFVRNNGTLLCYINGVFNGSIAEGTQIPTYFFGAHMGCMFYNNTIIRYNQFNGRLDEFRIFNRALSAAEIQQLHNTLLPLKLGDLNAVLKQHAVQLSWQTLSEENTASFTVERSNDGSNFAPIGTLKAAGQSSTVRSYAFTDAAPVPGVNYYRLKMTDLDQTHTYSRVITIKNESSRVRFQLYPNPVVDNMQLRIPMNTAGNVVIRINDAAGRVLYTKTTVLPQGDNTLSIPLGHWSPGQYFLQLEKNGERISQSFSKQ